MSIMSCFPSWTHISFMESGSMALGIAVPMKLLSERTLVTPSTSLSSLVRAFIFASLILSSRMMKWVVAMLKSFFIVLSADIEGRSCGIALSIL